jgi:hypothetical protein
LWVFTLSLTRNVFSSLKMLSDEMFAYRNSYESPNLHPYGVE